jgi:hypothetical protein
MSHLRPETIFGYEQGLLLPDELRAVHEHVESCEACRELVADRMGANHMAAQLQVALAATEAPAPASNWRPYAVAAGVLLAVLGAWWGMRDRPSPEPELAALRLPEFLTELADERRELMGVPPGTSRRLESPRATAVLGPDVTFSWTPVEGAAWRYVVRVFRLDGEPVTASGELVEPRWTATLPAGANYQWQVTATRPGAEPATLPGPTERPPRFRVIATSRASSLPAGSLRRGIACANEGLIDEARHHLEQAAQHDRRAAALLDQLNRRP